MALSYMQQPRQQYGLGSLVKSIGKGVKKFVKSPLGKAAILGVGAFGLPGGAFGMKGLLPQGMRSLGGISGSLFGTAGNDSYAMPGRGIFTPGTKGLLSKFKNMGTGTKIGIGSALATYLGSQGMEEEQIEEVQRDPNKLRPYLRDLFRKLNPSLPDGQIEEMVEVNVSEYATGGRVGYSEGGDYEDKFMELVSKLRELGFSQQEAIEEAKKKLDNNMAQGGRVGLYAGSPRGGIETLDIEDEEIITPHDLKMEEGVQITDDLVSDPDRIDSINELSLELFGKELHLLSEEELDQLNDEADRLMQKFSRGNKQENMKMAGMGGAMEHLRYYGMNNNDIIEIYQEWKDSGYGGSFHQYVLDTVNPPDNYAQGGRVGLQGGGMDASRDNFKTPPSAPPPGHPEFNIGAGGGVTPIDSGGGVGGDSNKPNIIERIVNNPGAKIFASYLLPQTKMKKAWDMMNFVNAAGKIKNEDLIYGNQYQKGGRVGLALGSEDTAQAAGIMGNLPVRQNKAGVNELDLRETGGFIPPVGVKEKADDVPAMLSNNEFVWTADAVRAAGGGSVNKGAQILYDQMRKLEGKVG